MVDKKSIKKKKKIFVDYTILLVFFHY